MTKPFAGIRGVIFDLDGTLVDSQLDFEAMRCEMELPVGSPVLETVLKLTGERAAECWRILEQHELRGFQNAMLMPGVINLIEQLSRRGIRLAVVTRNGGRMARATLDRLGIPIDLLLSRDDAPPKPDSAALLQICRSWNFDPASVAMVGDYRFDLEAGRRAGCRTVLYSAASSVEELRNWRELYDLQVASFVQIDALLAWLDEPLQLP